MREDAQTISLAVGLGVSNTVGLFNTFTPDLNDVRKSGPDNGELVADLRHGEVSTILIAGGVAFGASVIVDSWLPLIVCLVLVGALAALYEYTLYQRPNRVAVPVPVQE